MPITNADLDAELVDRCGTLLVLVGKDGTTVSGTNPAFRGAKLEGLRSLGRVPASSGSVSDADLAAVADALVPQLFDIAELRLLRNVFGNLTLVDQHVSLAGKNFGQIRDGLTARIAELATFCRQAYGYGLAAPTGGTMDLGFAQTEPCASEPLYPGEGF